MFFFPCSTDSCIKEEPAGAGDKEELAGAGEMVTSASEDEVFVRCV